MYGIKKIKSSNFRTVLQLELEIPELQLGLCQKYANIIIHVSIIGGHIMPV